MTKSESRSLNACASQVGERAAAIASRSVRFVMPNAEVGQAVAPLVQVGVSEPYWPLSAFSGLSVRDRAARA